MQRFLEHAERFRTRTSSDEITQVDFCQQPSAGTEEYARHRTAHRPPGRAFRRIFTAIYSPQRRTVVEEALYLSNIASASTWFTAATFRAEPIMVDKLMEKVAAGKIELKTHDADEVLG